MFLAAKCSFADIAAREIASGIGVDSTAESQHFFQWAVTFRTCGDLTGRTGPWMALERTWMAASTLTKTGARVSARMRRSETQGFGFGHGMTETPISRD